MYPEGDNVMAPRDSDFPFGAFIVNSQDIFIINKLRGVSAALREV